MRVILTHEQADFDAIASLLGQSLLDESSFAILPTRINRNVRAFLTIYGRELRFYERNDLPKEGIEHITLVDTQSLISLKGMPDDPHVNVIDHHEPRVNLNPNWELTLSATGAAATIFVEALMNRVATITPLEATLLLLGIYEDTGSLTYTRTTPRDLRAAAYLLSVGASLQIANNYLNHPLSLKQQALYDQISAKIVSHEIHGHTILVGTGSAVNFDEELATIVHKLRDTLDPHGLFVLFDARGGVQLIARSTCDHLDVAEVARQFGGGGHPRAAAAMVKQGKLTDVHTRLLEILPGYVKPAITVAEIMSRGPQLLAPDTPLDQIAERMLRYSYEGYPVVDGARVLGLLTRRAVDRALSHKLNLPIRQLMQAGDVTVAPNDSIEHLQQVMTDTGWGQIPVLDPERETIVGIVTRTDLLKTLTPQPVIPGRINLADNIERSLPAGHLRVLRRISEIASVQNCALYIVGGFVRDLLLERPSLDFDLVVEGDAIELGSALVAKYGGRIITHSRFGTAKWMLPEDFSDADANRSLPESIDLVTARTEFYTHPTALPTVERGSIKLDLHRRDFTINTLAVRLDGAHYGALYDFWGGHDDLRQGVIRVLHSLSFVDDPTRMLRAVRFEQRFGFEIERRTRELMDDALALVARVSGDRVRHELNYVFAEARTNAIMARLDALGVLRAIHPALGYGEWLAQRWDALPHEPPVGWDVSRGVRDAAYHRVMSYLIWFIRLGSDAVDSIVERLLIPNFVVELIRETNTLWQAIPQLLSVPVSGLVAYLDNVSPVSLLALMYCSDDPLLRERLTRWYEHWQHIRAYTTGHDLRARNIAPGPIYKEILAQLRAAWLDGDITSEAEEADRLEILLEAHGHV